MKKFAYFLFVGVLTIGCTSKTIFPPPKDLIPADTMSMMLKDLFVSNAARNIKNKKLQRQINYHPLVFKKFKIDSARFERSNFYYTSRIDDYEDILNDVMLRIETERKVLAAKKQVKDSIYQDSVNKLKEKRRLQRKKDRANKTFGKAKI